MKKHWWSIPFSLLILAIAFLGVMLLYSTCGHPEDKVERLKKTDQIRL